MSHLTVQEQIQFATNNIIDAYNKAQTKIEGLTADVKQLGNRNKNLIADLKESKERIAELEAQLAEAKATAADTVLVAKVAEANDILAEVLGTAAPAAPVAPVAPVATKAEETEETEETPFCSNEEIVEAVPSISTINGESTVEEEEPVVESDEEFGDSDGDDDDDFNSDDSDGDSDGDDDDGDSDGDDDFGPAELEEEADHRAGLTIGAGTEDEFVITNEEDSSLDFGGDVEESVTPEEIGHSDAIKELKAEMGIEIAAEEAEEAEEAAEAEETNLPSIFTEQELSKYQKIQRNLLTELLGILPNAKSAKDADIIVTAKNCRSAMAKDVIEGDFPVTISGKGSPGRMALGHLVKHFTGAKK